MRRLLLTVLLAAVAVAGGGCVGPTLDDHEYREAAVDSLDRARDRIDAARLTAEAAGNGRAPQPLVATTMGELEHAAAYVQEAFGTRQPPTPDMDAVRAETLPLLGEASSLLADLRIAAFRGDLVAVGERVPDLEELSTRLQRRSEDVAP